MQLDDELEIAKSVYGISVSQQLQYVRDQSYRRVSNNNLIFIQMKVKYLKSIEGTNVLGTLCLTSVVNADAFNVNMLSISDVKDVFLILMFFWTLF